MKPVDTWMVEYAYSHQHPVNKIIHRICIPVIIFSLAGMLRVIPFPEFPVSLFILNWATIFLFIVLVYYFYLSWRLAIGMLICTLMLYAILLWLESTVTNLGQISVILFIIGWFGQFIGHTIEKKRPSFFLDIQFLLIGPLFLLTELYRKLKIFNE